MQNGRVKRATAKILARAPGFTLIELLVVFAVIGILVAIAIPQLSLHRARGVDAQMKADIKNAVIAMESYYSSIFSYPTSVTQISSFGYRPTDGVSLAINFSTPTDFTVTATKPGGTQVSFTYNSATGQTN